MGKKRKFKRWVRVVFVILVVIIVLVMGRVFLCKDEVFNENIGVNEDELIDEILSYELNEVDGDFLGWIGDNYSWDVLVELNRVLSDNSYDDDIWHDLTGYSFIVLNDLYNDSYSDQGNVKEVLSDGTATISFIGDVSLADNWYIAQKYDERGKGIYGILSEDVVDILNDSTLVIANNEFTVSTRGTPLANKLYTFRASPERLAIYEEMGVDLVTLANNHVYDYGEEAFLDMLSYLDEYDIPHIGAGYNLEDAGEPYYFIVNGYKIAFVNANRSEKNILTPGATLDSAGVLRCYDPEYFTNLIETTKEDCDYLVALIHWGKEDSTELEQVQLDTSKVYIDAGADVIVGTHAHVLQGVEFYNGKVIMYNLGDFIFNDEVKDTGIFQLQIDDDGNFKYYFIPARQEDEYTYLLEGDDRSNILEEMTSLSSDVIFDESGEFYGS